MNRVLQHGGLDNLLGAAVGGGMEQFWNFEPGRLALWIAVPAFLIALLAMLLAGILYFHSKIHPKPAKKEPLASQWLSKYAELHSQGGLSDEEFRTIKTKLAERLQEELKDNGETG